MFSDISMMLRKLILCFFVMYALSIKGQGSSICTVIDAETGEPLSFVRMDVGLSLTMREGLVLRLIPQRYLLLLAWGINECG